MKLMVPVVLLFALSSVNSQTIVPAEQLPFTVDASAMKKLDDILDRLRAIEGRLDRMEAKFENRSSWQVDSLGILRDSSGRPMGYWGVDGPSSPDSY